MEHGSESTEAGITVRKFTEAWRVQSRDKVEQGGDDDFLVPWETINQTAGEMIISARAWFAETLPTGFLQTRDAAKAKHLPWGYLRGTHGLHEPPQDAPQLRRRWCATWNRGQKPRFTVVQPSNIPDLYDSKVQHTHDAAIHRYIMLIREEIPEHASRRPV